MLHSPRVTSSYGRAELGLVLKRWSFSAPYSYIWRSTPLPWMPTGLASSAVSRPPFLHGRKRDGQATA